MNKKQIVASLNKIANTLDYSGHYIEASAITKVMLKVAQMNVTPVVAQDIEFLNRHPSLLEEYNRLTTQEPKEGVIDISDIYYKTPYWNMPQRIFEQDIPARIEKLKNFNYHKELAAKRMDFISRKLEAENLSSADRQSLLNDLTYLKRYTGVGSLSKNPALNKPRPEPQTAYEAMQNEQQDVLDSMKPKTPDFNQMVYNIVFRKIKQKNPQKSDTEIGVSLSNKANLKGYRDIANDQELYVEILKEIKTFSQKFINAEEAEQKLSKIFVDKVAFSGVRK
jgi:hypothetical protein